MALSTCENVRSEAARGGNPERPLTHLLEPGERGLAVKATRACSVDGCDRPHYSRGWCEAHYARWRKTGVTGPADLGEYTPRTSRACQADGCIESHYSQGWCNKHYIRVKKHGDPHHVGVGGKSRIGPLHPNWRDEDVSYRGAHRRIESRFGRAQDHICAHCGTHAEDWAYDGVDPNERVDAKTGLLYSLDPLRYRPLCKSCHRRSERTGAP